MLTKLEHITLLVSDLDEATLNYETIFGFPCFWRSREENDGYSSVVFNIGEIALQIVSPKHKDTEGKFAGKTLNSISNLSFTTTDIQETQRIFSRRGLNPSEVNKQSFLDGERKQFRCSNVPIEGIDVDVVEPLTNIGEHKSENNGRIQSLDHLVIDTPNVDRTLATYGTRLGFRLALERNAPQWGVHFLFFRIGGITFEVVHRLNVDHDTSQPDKSFGFSWASNNLEQTRDRLVSSGRDVSEIRTGRRPGSRVFTLRNKTCGIPTIIIEHEAQNVKN